MDSIQGLKRQQCCHNCIQLAVVHSELNCAIGMGCSSFGVMLTCGPCFEDCNAYSHWSDMDFTAPIRFLADFSNAKQHTGGDFIAHVRKANNAIQTMAENLCQKIFAVLGLVNIGCLVTTPC